MRRVAWWVAAALTLALGVLGCSGGDGSSADAGAPAASSSSGPPLSPSGGHDAIGGSVSKDFGTEPKVAVPTSAPAKALRTKDIVPGTGAVAGATSTVTVRYVGYHYATRKPFDSTWDRSKPDTFSLNGVFVGLARGIAGMREGGRREMVIPPSLAYGTKGQGQIRPSETLLFVVDLVTVN